MASHHTLKLEHTSEQRIVKAVAGEAAIHYHYDGEGRLIAETDAATGETIREYVWLGLTPIASFGADNPAANDNNPEDCTDEIAALEADIADRTTRIENNTARITELGDLATDKQNRIANNAARITELGGLITDKQSRIENNATRITELGALITDKQSRIATNTARITELEALIVDKQNRIAALNPDTRAERIAELEALIITHQERIEFLTTRNGELAALITAHETRITELTTRNAELAALITAHETRITELTNRNAELASLITGHEERSVFLTERNEVLTTQRETFQAELDALLATGCNDPAAGSNVTYLHSDHLGRPKFATNANGDIVWDEGITSPFGVQITAMAAQTQALMFPGQYEDLETTGAGVTLSHNWHRTYDPTLGRYLQSDPIGLAGGLNRYAYVGGNPLGWVDVRGLNAEEFIKEILRRNREQHEKTVDYWRKRDTANGWRVGPKNVYVDLPVCGLRIYDYVITSPVSGITYGVEVKSTRIMKLSYIKRQFQCDVELACSKIGRLSRNAIPIQGVAYRGGFLPMLDGDGVGKVLADSKLKAALKANNMDYQVEPIPGIFTK